MEQVLNTVMISAEEYAELKRRHDAAEEGAYLYLERIAALEGERDRLRFLLRSIYNGLPTRRDWLDPSLERSIRDELENPDAN